MLAWEYRYTRQHCTVRIREIKLMTIERALRLMAGLVVVLSLTLAHFFHPAWLLLALFAALNLIQSAFTNWCPAMILLRKAGLPGAACDAEAKP